jgi:hypothetical protein
MQQGIFLTQLYKLDYLAGSKIKNMAVGTTPRAFSAFIASVEIHITIALNFLLQGIVSARIKRHYLSSCSSW